MKKIHLRGKLGQGKFALVDDEDYERISKYKWYYKANGGYATTTLHLSGSHANKNIRQLSLSMHRLVLKLHKGDGLIVDHRKGGGLDNRKKNLRITDYCGNARNRIGQTSFKGVHFNKETSLWETVCKEKYLGSFKNRKIAALAYDKAARKWFEEFAVPNFPDEYLDESILLTHIDKKPKPVGKTSKYTGVCWFKRSSVWRATCRRRHLGYFDNEYDAYKAYLEAVNENT